MFGPCLTVRIFPEHFADEFVDILAPVVEAELAFFQIKIKSVFCQSPKAYNEVVPIDWTANSLTICRILASELLERAAYLFFIGTLSVVANHEWLSRQDPYFLCCVLPILLPILIQMVNSQIHHLKYLYSIY